MQYAVRKSPGSYGFKVRAELTGGAESGHVKDQRLTLLKIPGATVNWA